LKRTNKRIIESVAILALNRVGNFVLDIIAIIGACVILGKMLKERGQRPLGFLVMFAALCVAGEFAGAYIAKRLGAKTSTEIQLAALFGAAWGAAIGLKIILMLPDLSQPATADIDRPDYAPNLPSSSAPSD